MIALLSNASFRKQLFATLTKGGELHRNGLSKVLNGLHLASQRPESQIPLAELNVLALESFGSAWARQQDASQSKFWESRKNRSYFLSTCSAAAKILNASGSYLSISSGDALNIIEDYPAILLRDIDSSGEGSHMK